MRQSVQAWLVTISVFAAGGYFAAAQNAASVSTPASPQTAPATGVTATQAPVSSAAPAEATVAGGRLHGVVKSGNVPLPGVTVTAQNTLTGRRYTTTTDITGAWSMTIPKDGRYVVRTEFAAFAQQSQEALFNATKSRDQALNFNLMLASRAAAQEQQQTAGQARIQQAIRQLASSGMQNLSLTSALDSETEAAAGGTESAAGNGAALPSAANNTDFSSESVSVNGQNGQVSPLAGMDEDRLRDVIETLRAEGAIGGLFGGGMGGFGGAFGGGFVGGPGGPGGGMGGRGGGMGGPGGPGGGRGGFFIRGGNFRNFNPGQPHGAIFWFGSNSALNAEPFSLEGQQQEQPANGSNRFGLTFMSAPYIPGLTKPSGKDNVFLTISGTRSSSPEDEYATVPTADQRSGDLGNGMTVTPVPQAVALLNYIPLPNLATSTTQGYNYHLLTTAQSNTTQAGFRYMRSIGANSSPFPFGGRGGFGGFGGGRSQQQGLRQSINVNYNWTHTASDKVGLIPILGGKTASDQYSLQAGYTVGYGRLTNIFNANWNRSNGYTINFFTNGTDIATQVGVLGPGGVALNSSPLNYGLPDVSITDFPSGGISEIQPTFSINQTISLSETLAWRHGKHNMRFGGDYRRVHNDFLGGGNGTGSFSFTGAYTGSSLGDFLTGEPLQTTIASADGKSYLRDNVFDGYAQDDWRVRSDLTVLYGIRYEYFAPYTEKYNHLSMVDTNPDGGFTSVGQVEAGATSSGYGPLRDSLLFPYRTAFAPRLGFAWRVPKIKNMVVRGGYGVNYEVGEYGTFAKDTAYQPPFVNEQTNICATAAPCYTLANGFPAPNAIGTYAINPHYLLPHVQAYNLDVQKTLPWGIVVNLGYNGATAGNMDIKIAPRAAPSSPNTNPANTPFYYLESGAFYHMNAGTVRVNKRLSGGIALGANYEWMHAIDNAGGVGGNSPLTAQNWQDIGAEASNSTIDQRHTVSGEYLYELPFGQDKRWVTTGTASHVLEGLSISGTFTFATGNPLNVTYPITTLNAECGTGGTLRPDYVSGVSPTAGGGSLQRWFNPNAFTAPSAANPAFPCAAYGNVPRDVLTGPGTVTNNMSLSKTLQMGETRSWEFRATASNVFNTVQYSDVDTTATSPTFGRVTTVGTMRAFQFTSRFRF